MFILLSFQARYDILLRESARNGRSALQLEYSERAFRAGTFPSQSRRVIPITELAQDSLNESKEFNEGASKAPLLLNTGEDIENEDNAVQAVLVSENRRVFQDAQEDDKSEPKDLLTAMDSFDTLFCRRCLV